MQTSSRSVVLHRQGDSFVQRVTLPLLRVTFSLWGLFILASFLLILGSRQFSAPEQGTSSGVMRCQGVPCFRGIIPGQSTWDEALAAFGGQQIIRTDGSFAEIAFLPCTNKQAVASILLDQPLDSSLTVQTMIALYGTPTYLDIYPKSGTLLLHFPSAHVAARFEGDQFKASARILTVVLGGLDTPAGTSAVCNPASADEPALLPRQFAWMGFAGMHRYLGGG